MRCSKNDAVENSPVGCFPMADDDDEKPRRFATSPKSPPQSKSNLDYLGFSCGLRHQFRVLQIESESNSKFLISAMYKRATAL